MADAVGYMPKSAGTIVGTPSSIFDPLHEEFGFSIDVCALPDNAKCDRFYTPETDGLKQDWGGEVCWCNPPYGREIREWIKKAHEESLRGATVVCLLPARTDTAWWHEYAEKATERRFLRGRIKFVGRVKDAPFPCVLVIFKPAAEEAPTC